MYEYEKHLKFANLAIYVLLYLNTILKNKKYFISKKIVYLIVWILEMYTFISTQFIHSIVTCSIKVPILEKKYGIRKTRKIL